MRIILALAAIVGGLIALFTMMVVDPSTDGEYIPALGSGLMFDRIAHRYDVTNRVMSLGMDLRWRQKMVDAMAVKPSDRVLDLATGTADVAILEGRIGATVLGIDPSEQMLNLGRHKISTARLDSNVTLVTGDATHLVDLQNASFDKISIAFGIRNIPDFNTALSEMRRVAADRATLAIMEFCEPEHGLLAPVARLFIRHAIPRLGAFLSGAHWAEYRHLQASIAAFPPPSDFAKLISQAGFRVRSISYLGFGSVALYLAVADPPSR